MAYYSGYSPADKEFLKERDAREESDRLRREAEARSDFLYERSKQDQLDAEDRALAVKKTTATTNVMPSWSPPGSYNIPEYTPYVPGKAPTYAAPTWDEGAIESLTQKKAAPGLRSLRQQVQRVTGRRYDNPQVGRMTLREALQGYGSGISSVMGSAGETALGEYGKRYAVAADVAKTNYSGAMARWSGETAARTEGARTNYQAELDKRKTAFNAAWDKWKASMGTKTTTSQGY